MSLEPPEHRLGLRLFGVKGKVKKEKAVEAKEAGKAEKKEEAPDGQVVEADKKE